VKLPLQITTRKMSLSKNAFGAIQKKAQKLEQFFDQIISCRVMVETPHRHKQQGLLYNVRVDLTVPGAELVVKREPNEDIYVAIRDTFDAAQRQLKEFVRRRRGDVKNHHNGVHATQLLAGPSSRVNHVGRVRELFADQGFGYLEAEDGREIYFSGSILLDGALDEMEVGMPVRFAENFATTPGRALEVSMR